MDVRIALGILNVLSVAAKWVPIAFIAGDAGNALIALAGKKTEANVIVKYLTETDSGSSVTVFGLLAFACMFWALIERKLRHRAIERLTNRTEELEKKLNASRSTSGLTPDGRTHPRDR